MSRSQSYLVLFVLLIVVVIVFVIPATLRLPHPSAPITLTRTYIHELYASVGFLERDHGTNIETIIGTNISGIDLNRRLAEVLLTNSWYCCVGASTNGTNVTLVDAWGNPFVMNWKGTTSSLLSKRLAGSTNALLIWSCGKDGRNDYGNGDDVTY